MSRRDIYLDDNGDLQIANTDVFKAENILNIQIGTLYYAQTLGIDLARFIDPGIEIQPETFRAYTIQELTRQGVQLETVSTVIDEFITNLTYVATEPDAEGAENVI